MQPTTSTTFVHHLLSPQTICLGLPGLSKEEVLNNLIDVLAGNPAVADLDELRAAVFMREQMMSTGVGKELALPHAKTGAVRETVAAFAVTAEPVAFGAIDNLPVRLVFLLVGTEAARSQHIKILSRISRLMNREAVRQRLLDAPDAQTVLTIFEEAEDAMLEQ